ncbi:MAG: ABC transporter permease, partial [Lachnospiraceae bacterium]|nr:ABC transporter permease [Lachnospiraceae bacterium]
MKYIFKKIVSLIIILFIVSLLAFLAFQVIPGD